MELGFWYIFATYSSLSLARLPLFLVFATQIHIKVGHWFGLSVRKYFRMMMMTVFLVF